MTDQNHLLHLWKTTLGDDGGNGWATLSGGATYRAPGDQGGTLSGGSTLGGTLSGGSTMGGAEGISTTRIGLGGFELVEEIGRGGMGVVWRARQASLARDVAVKLIRAEAANEKSRRGFVSEALVNGVLDHPNIVPVHELGSTPDGEAFLAMKLVGGTAWDRLLHPKTSAEQTRAKTFDLDKHLGVLESVANAVAFAHSRGIVHRDLKPENVMVGEYGEVLVMDWGIAVDIREKPDPADSRATPKSAIRGPAGTPSYMAPELAEGRGADIGPWTDVYLLGAILCEILRGTPPHQGNSLMAILLSASRSEAPTFPAGTPEGLITICRTALAKDHRARYATVPALQAALAEYRKHRESDLVAASARKALERCAGRDASALSGSDRASLYGDYAEAVAGYRQALSLWSENATARQGEADARRGYALAALGAGDLALAEAQAAPLDDAPLKQRIAAAITARTVRERAARRNRSMLIAAVALIVVGLATGVLLVTGEQRKTAEQRDLAVGAKAEAAAQRDVAVQERQRAQGALADAAMHSAALLADQGSLDQALASLWQAVDADRDADGRHGQRAQEAWHRYQLVLRGLPTVSGPLPMPAPQHGTPVGADPAGWVLTAGSVGADGRLVGVWQHGAGDSDRPTRLAILDADGASLPAWRELPALPAVIGLAALRDGPVVVTAATLDGFDWDGARRWSQPIARLHGPVRVLDPDRMQVGAGQRLLTIGVDGLILAEESVPQGGFAAHRDQLIARPIASRLDPDRWRGVQVDQRPDLAAQVGRREPVTVRSAPDASIRSIAASPVLMVIEEDAFAARLLQYGWDGVLQQDLAGSLPLGTRIAGLSADGGSVITWDPQGRWRQFRSPVVLQADTLTIPGADRVVALHRRLPLVLVMAGDAGERQVRVLAAGDWQPKWQQGLPDGEVAIGFSRDGSAVIIGRIGAAAIMTDPRVDGGASRPGTSVTVRVLDLADGSQLGRPIDLIVPDFRVSDPGTHSLTGDEFVVNPERDRLWAVAAHVVHRLGDGSLDAATTTAIGRLTAHLDLNGGTELTINPLDGTTLVFVPRDDRRPPADDGEPLWQTVILDRSFQPTAEPALPIGVIEAEPLADGEALLAVVSQANPSAPATHVLERWSLQPLARRHRFPGHPIDLLAVDQDRGVALTLADTLGGVVLHDLQHRLSLVEFPLPHALLDHDAVGAGGTRGTGRKWLLAANGRELWRVEGGRLQRVQLTQDRPIPAEPPGRQAAWQANDGWLAAAPAVHQVPARLRRWWMPAWQDRFSPAARLQLIARDLLLVAPPVRAQVLAGPLGPVVNAALAQRDAAAAQTPEPPSGFTIADPVAGYPTAVRQERRLRWIPAGRHVHDGQAVTLSSGFWIDPQPLPFDRPYTTLLFGPGFDLYRLSTRNGDRAEMTTDQVVQAVNAANTTWRLLGAAEAVAALAHGISLEGCWLADGWQPGSGTATDPWAGAQALVWEAGAVPRLRVAPGIGTPFPALFGGRQAPTPAHTLLGGISSDGRPDWGARPIYVVHP